MSVLLGLRTTHCLVVAGCYGDGPLGKTKKDITVILAEALEMGTAQAQAAYLDSVCGDDASLREEVESLLKIENRVGDFLETTVDELDITLDSLSVMEGPGTVIGRYHLLERIGEGGMAVVYMAQQEHPIRRNIAFKIIKLGMDTRQVITRFEAERQALALMDHPNIAKVLDAGSTDTGRPYFVMELVNGVPITRYCDKNKLNTRERLNLFIRVCQAVQHAHQKGLIHRDLKPSNILVTFHESRPEPKVIDFGIAKATQDQLAEYADRTKLQTLVGTPAYMSPEQTQMGA
ncbi:MAG: serine/threonine protein kinase, partial [Planctomycetes bacterium]|nr:serine/threonine protein kinase [Planctomycetota bacterium]